MCFDLLKECGRPTGARRFRFAQNKVSCRITQVQRVRFDYLKVLSEARMVHFKHHKAGRMFAMLEEGDLTSAKHVCGLHKFEVSV